MSFASLKHFSQVKDYVVLFGVLLGAGIVYRRMEDKRLRDTTASDYSLIRKYLSGGTGNNIDGFPDLRGDRPIMWIHVPRQKNARNWVNFGSRTSLDLNQPYLRLTIKSIVAASGNSFTICLIDDASFKQLMPAWGVDMTKLTGPVLDNVRQLGMAKLLYEYGGIICPHSFVCLKNLLPLYLDGIGANRDQMFACNFIAHTTSAATTMAPSLQFCGATAKNARVGALIQFLELTISTDSTAASVFNAAPSKWLTLGPQNIAKVRIIEGTSIGTQSGDLREIRLDDLLSNHYLDLAPDAYGIYIPAAELLKRHKYEWFARLSEKQVLESNTIYC